jgi:feruloyl esterase
MFFVPVFRVYGGKKVKNIGQRKTALCLAIAGGFAVALSGCGGGGGSDDVVVAPGLPQLAEAKAGTLISCTDLATKAAYANTTFSSAALVPAGTVAVSGVNFSAPEHCLVKGEMNRRTSAVDGASYAIGFEMRLPTAWNGRYLYQGNGGVDGSVTAATGNFGGVVENNKNALAMGFAIISSDAGHQPPTPNFGVDPQARLDYGYQAAITLTPMAKNLVKVAYGRAPDRSYFGGCSNGGRHTLVATTRLADQYDGFLAGSPGFHLPKAAVEQEWKAQQYARIATSTVAAATALNPAADIGQPDITTAVNPAEFKLVGAKILAKCDTLDGVKDDIVSDVVACQAKFDIRSDVPTCAAGAARDGTCLTDAQKNVLSTIWAGSKNANGENNYSNFWMDPGISGANWVNWHYTMSQQRDPGAIAFIYNSPAMAVSAFNATTGLKFALNLNIATAFANIFTTDATYKESAWSFMTPKDETNLKTLRSRGAKLIVYHGSSDGVFSSADTAKWYSSLQSAMGVPTEEYARFFIVPGMGHCTGGGPTTDQFDAITPLVNWVEKGQAPEQIIAKARGTGANAVNPELPASWSATRTRPLCAYPKVARYNGTGDIESASSFTCKL